MTKERKAAGSGVSARPTPVQTAWLKRGVSQPGGKLPLFDGDGKAIARRTILSCIEAGWAERWIENPVKPDWLVCRLTPAGYAAVEANPPRRVAGSD
ncbi:MAG: hypothetical protein AB7O39_13510 [Flavobacteriaceae bacterium]